MFAVSPTDLEWFEYIRGLLPVGVVNFWTPTPWELKNINKGDRLYFMLKSPVRLVGGYGKFVRYLNMSSGEAWDRYGLANGVSNREELVRKIDMYAKKRAKDFISSESRSIGCIELNNVVTLDDDEFFDPSRFGYDISKYIVKIKYVREVDKIALGFDESITKDDFVLVEGGADKNLIFRKERKGQCFFRRTVLKNYENRCCITGENIDQLLEAAHIQVYVNERSNHPQNGLCLRVDIHRLFDEGLISITNEYTVQVSAKLAGTSYTELNGKKIFLPKEKTERPSDEALAYHRKSFR